MGKRRTLKSAFAAALVGAALAVGSAALAVEPDEILPDPVLEARARAISAGLRCLVCQNQSIDDSSAPLARDLRLLVRERLKAGASDAEVLAFVEQRYGKFVLLRPPLTVTTALLWATPILLLAGAGLLVWRGRSRRAAEEAGLSAEEEARLARVLADGEGERGERAG